MVTSRRLTALATAVLGTVIGTTLNVAPAAAADHDGGCFVEVSDGFRVSACISRDGVWLKPDAYVTQKATRCFWISIDVRDNEWHLLSRKQSTECRTGRFLGTNTTTDPQSRPYLRGPYFTEVTIVADNRVRAVVDSEYQS